MPVSPVMNTVLPRRRHELDHVNQIGDRAAPADDAVPLEVTRLIPSRSSQVLLLLTLGEYAGDEREQLIERLKPRRLERGDVLDLAFDPARLDVGAFPKLNDERGP